MQKRSLRNFIKLRDSGAAWEPMRELAKEIYNNIPRKYQILIKKQ